MEPVETAPASLKAAYLNMKKKLDKEWGKEPFTSAYYSGYLGDGSTFAGQPYRHPGVQEKQAAIVLIRGRASLDGGNPSGKIERLPPLFALPHGKPKNAGKIDQQNWWPSSETAEEGWRYLVLPPGMYRLVVLPPGHYSGQSSHIEFYSHPWRDGEGFAQPPSFRLNVPPGVQILYAGSLRLKCEGNWRGKGAPGCSADLQPEDETEKAREIAKAHLAEFGPPVTSLMRRY